MLHISVIRLYLCYFYVCSDGLSVKVFPSNQFSSHHSMTGTCYIPGMSTDICFHVAGNECQDFHMMKQKGGGYVFLSVRTLLCVNKNGKENGPFN